ncbi:VOC family protein [Streptomyces odontomachi]|uniref:VOC family protein n=1 Tax=Streptomyces odontomachi TaxID=2944940 RepID=UPI00210BA5E0|nr:VOC family protein [Streptomyces sp. ODS25]
MLIAVDHVQLAAPPGSEDALRAYYVGVLGMREIPKPPALAARGGCWFEAEQSGTSAAQSTEGGGARRAGVQLHLGIEQDFRAARKAHPGLRVHGIAAYAARLAERGAKVVWDDDLPGHRRFYSEDPVGNRLEFLEPTGA